MNKLLSKLALLTLLLMACSRFSFATDQNLKIAVTVHPIAPKDGDVGVDCFYLHAVQLTKDGKPCEPQKDVIESAYFLKNDKASTPTQTLWERIPYEKGFVFQASAAPDGTITFEATLSVVESIEKPSLTSSGTPKIIKTVFKGSSKESQIVLKNEPYEIVIEVR